MGPEPQLSARGHPFITAKSNYEKVEWGLLTIAKVLVRHTRTQILVLPRIFCVTWVSQFPFL